MIKRALISVHNKDHIAELAKVLTALNVEIISTGGTYKHLTENGIKVIKVEDVTGFPEVLGGRVKTLHPKIAAAILANKNYPEHIAELKAHDILPIDLVIVSLYPFRETISKEGVTKEEAIEQIDIGGVTLIRSAAKNYENVIILTDPDQYPIFTEMLKTNDLADAKVSKEYRTFLAHKAFEKITQYDKDIAGYFSKLSNGEQSLRYGENPHQPAELIKTNFDELFEVLHGKELSYNNLLDVDAAYNLISEFDEDDTACVIIKHGNPSGTALGTDTSEAYKRALSTDPVSAFGGIIAFNKKIDFNTCLEVDKLFSEIILAPDFEKDALKFLKKKKNRRIIRFNFDDPENKFEERKITGGYLKQHKNLYEQKKEDLKLVSGNDISETEMNDLLFASKVIKHVKSNAVIFVKDKMTLGIGAGQPSRVDSTRIAVLKAKEFGKDLQGSIAASDAFFPFPDGLIQIAEAGAKIILQPGGSVKDDEVIEEAKKRELTMYLSGVRHFRH